MQTGVLPPAGRSYMEPQDISDRSGRSSDDRLSRDPRRTTFERACAGYDEQFASSLIEEILHTIARASVLSDANVLAVRTGETAAALVACLTTVLALCPDYDVPSRLRERVDEIAKKLRRDVAKARAAGLADTILGATREGHA